jgi:hypothetical protein
MHVFFEVRHNCIFAPELCESLESMFRIDVRLFLISARQTVSILEVWVKFVFVSEI